MNIATLTSIITFTTITSLIIIMYLNCKVDQQKKQLAFKDQLLDSYRLKDLTLDDERVEDD